MPNKDITQTVLETIKDKKIIPRPKWEFVMKNYFIWTVSIISLIIGSFAFAVIIYMFKNNDWDLYQQIGKNLLNFTLATLPYLWLIFLSLFIFLAYYNFKHTKSGYKYKLNLVIGGSIITSIILGILFYNIGFGQAIDNIFDEKIPVYRRLMMHRAAIWHQPDKGLLFGTIESIQAPDRFKLRDLKNNPWIVIHPSKDLRPLLILNQGLRIKIFGEKINDDSFKAKEIRPLRKIPKKMFFNRIMRLRQ